MKTFDDYIKAVKQQSEVKKNEAYGSFLLKPSPAQLRDFCLMVYDRGLSKKDKDQFDHFFQPKENEDLRRCISKFDVEKLKPIGIFLRGKSETTNLNNLELIAILVDFQQRPMNKFLKSDVFDFDDNEWGKESEISAFTENKKTGSINEIKNKETKSNSKHKILFFGLALITFFSVGYIAKDSYFPEKQCMQWQEDHYVSVDCEVQSFSVINPIVPLNKETSNLRRVQLKKGMLFFKYKKPLYYYHKFDKDSVEFFNAPGLHPISGEPLKKISWYMINKYVK